MIAQPLSIIYLLAAGLDYAGIGSLIAAVTATVALFFAHKNNKRAARTTESVSYVDNNLKTMQATLDWLTNDNSRLREINEEQRLQIINLDDEVQRIEDIATQEALAQSEKIRSLSSKLDRYMRDLDECQIMCASLKRQIEKRSSNESNNTSSG